MRTVSYVTEHKHVRFSNKTLVSIAVFCFVIKITSYMSGQVSSVAVFQQKTKIKVKKFSQV